MKFFIKVLFAPVIAVLVIFIWVCALTLRLSAWVFGLIGTILGTFGLIVLLFNNVTNGVIVLRLAFLISPIGIPLIAAWVIGQMQRFRYFVQYAVYGKTKVCPSWAEFVTQDYLGKRQPIFHKR